MLRSMVRSSDQKSGISAYPLTIATISFFDFVKCDSFDYHVSMILVKCDNFDYQFQFL